MHRFAQWCVLGRLWWWWSWDLSWLSSVYFGARQLEKPGVAVWSKPILEAFCAGAWILYWTEDTLFWVAKPRVHVERPTATTRRLHNATGPALESAVENLYFWHGVMVPAFVVTRPEWITVQHIESEENAEVRRIMIERYGQARYLVDSGATEIHRDDWGILFRKEIPGDEALVMVKVVNSTPEPDGRFKDYFLRVHPECRPILRTDADPGGRALGEPQALTAHNAVASTFGLRGEEYEPEFQT